MNRPGPVLRQMAIATLLAAAPWAAAVARGRDVPVPEWREQAVRYLLTKGEDQLYKGLESREERQRFIDKFWKRRDPTPETPYNEFRDEFWRRVSAANDLFNDTPYEGWITDRGKIYILLGPPDDVLEEQVARSHRGIVLWIYRSSWAKEIGPNVVVAFARDVTGAFRISTAPSVDADVFRGLAPNTPAHLQGTSGEMAALLTTRVPGIGATDPYLVAQGVPAGVTELSLLADLGRLQQTDHLILSEYVNAQALFGDVPILAAADYFKADDGTTYTALTVAVRSKSLQFREWAGKQVPHVDVFGRVEDPDSGELLRSLERQGDFVPSPDNPAAGVDDYLVFQAGAGLAPGRYRARVTVHDRVAEKVGRYDLDLDVPDLGGRDLALSSLRLAERLEPRPADRAGAPPAPYEFGNLVVIPKPGLAYATDQEFAFYFQVYNARPDAATGHPLLDLHYGFEAKGEDGEFQAVGKGLDLRDQTQAAQGFSFSLADWPIGTYRLQVTVADRLQGVTAERAAEFVVR